MRNLQDPRQARLFDPFEGVISPAGWKLIETGWQGVFRHLVLHQLPASRLGNDLSRDMGRPSAELFSMCGLLLIRDFQNWTVPETLEAALFRSDVQYALNLEPGFEISQRTIERYIARLQGDEGLADELMTTVTDELVRHLELTVAKQRLDSTHILSDMAVFGRTRMMAISVKRFLTQVKRLHKSDYEMLPAELVKRYQVTDGRLFSDAKTSEQRQHSRLLAAEDLYRVIQHFAPHAVISQWPSYQTLVTIFEQQCEVVEDKVAVKAKPGGEVILNPSDGDASYSRHKGAGYQAQIVETSHEDNEVELILAVQVEGAAKADAHAVEPLLDELSSRGHRPEELCADASYGSDENVLLAKDQGVELISPVPGSKAYDADEVNSGKFTIDEHHQVISCPAGHAPESFTYHESTDRMTVKMSPELCAGCPLLEKCPVELNTGPEVKKPSARWSFRMSEHRSNQRRDDERTEAFRERYRKRSGIESTNSGLKRRLGLNRLRVRGLKAVTTAVLLKITGWNLLRASASAKIQKLVAEKMANWGFGRLVGPDFRIPKALPRLSEVSPANGGQNPLATRSSPTHARHRLAI